MKLGIEAGGLSISQSPGILGIGVFCVVIGTSLPMGVKPSLAARPLVLHCQMIMICDVPLLVCFF